MGGTGLSFPFIEGLTFFSLYRRICGFCLTEGLLYRRIADLHRSEGSFVEGLLTFIEGVSVSLNWDELFMCFNVPVLYQPYG